MSSDNKKEIGPISVTIFAVFISFAVVAVIYFVQNETLKLDALARFLPKKQMSMNTMLDRGKTESVIDMISNKSEISQNSDTNLYTLGKAWYLTAWQRHDNDNWRTFARNPNDWFEGSDVDKALHYLNRAAESPNTFMQAATLIGVIYMEKGWFDKARTAFASVLKKDATQRDAYLFYGVALSRIGRNKEAIKHLENWQNYQNDFDFLRNLFSLYLFSEKNYAKAAVLGDMFLKTAPRGNPNIPRVRRELNDLNSRFPEYFNDTMIIIRDRPPEFRQRSR